MKRGDLNISDLSGGLNIVVEFKKIRFSSSPLLVFAICGYLIVVFLSLTVGNIVYPVLLGKYVRLNEEMFPEIFDIPGFPEIYIGGTDGIRFRPWMIILPVVSIVFLVKIF